MGFEALGIQAVAQGVPDFVGKLGQMQSAITATGRSGESLGDKIGAAAQALAHVGEVAVGVAAAGIGAATAAIAAALVEASEYEVVLTRIEGLLERSGEEMGVTMDQVQGLARQYMDLAGGTDHAVLAIEEMALRTGVVTKETLPEFIKTVLDMAAATGTDAVSAMRSLAIAEEAPSAALRRFRSMGIIFTKEEQEQIKALDQAGDTTKAFAIVMKRVGIATMGQAARQAETLAGQVTILRGHISEFVEDLGMKFLPMAKDVLAVVRPAIDTLLPKVAAFIEARFVPIMDRLVRVFLALVDAGPRSIEFFEALDGLIPGLGQKFRVASDRVASLIDKVREFVTKHKDDIVTAVKDIGKALGALAIGAGIFKVLQVLGSLTSGIGLVMAVIGLLGAAWRTDFLGMRTALTDWWEKTGRPTFEKVAAWLGEKGPQVVDAFSKAMSGLGTPLKEVGTWLEEHFGETLKVVGEWFDTEGRRVASIGRMIFTRLLEVAPKVGQFFSDLADWWKANGPAIAEAGGKLFDAFMRTVQTLVARILPTAIQLFDKVSAWFRENGPLIGEYATAMIGALAWAWEKVLGPAVLVVWDIVEPILDGILSLILGLAKAWMQFCTGDWAGGWQTVKETATTVIGDSLAAIKAFFDDVVSLFTGKSLRDVAESWEGVWENLKTIVSALPGYVYSLVPDFVQAGMDLAAGLARGIADKAGEVVSSALKAVEDAWNAVTEFLGIQSPSTRFRSVGEEAMRGLAIGIQGAVREPMAALTQAIQALTPTMQPARVPAPAVSSTAVTNNYTLNLSSSARVEPVAADFRLMAALHGRH